MIGKRVKDGDWPENPGEYSKWIRNGKVRWFVIPPKSGLPCGYLDDHTIIEHEDGTITVSPSILFEKRNENFPGWHGYLEKGIWREC